MDTEGLGKWQVLADEHGNLYFYNSITGETVWELPEEEATEASDSPSTVITDEGQGHFDWKSQQKEYNEFEVAVGVVDALMAVLETLELRCDGNKSKTKRKFVSPAAEARAKKHAVNLEKRKKREDERLVTAYLNLLIPRLNSEENASVDRQEVGSLFTADQSRQWQQERDEERAKKRRAVRRARHQHHEKVEALKRQQQLLIAFRSDLMKHLLGQIQCSTDLQKQRILMLTTPQTLADMMERSKELQARAEPELAEKVLADQRLAQQKYDKNIRKVFAAVDEAGTEKVHLLQILFAVFSMEKPHKYAAKVRGLAELLGSAELQRFLIDFVSQSNANDAEGARLITVDEFREFVSIIEEVLDHYAGVKAAVEDAENDIEATLSTADSAPGTSLAKARMAIMSEKKLKHELAVLKEAEMQLEAFHERERQKEFGSDAKSLVAAKEEWEKNHHHRLIRLEGHSPLYCGLCRRRKWELWRREQEEGESDYRSHWPALYALELKNEELRIVQERDKCNGIVNIDSTEVSTSDSKREEKETASTHTERLAKYELPTYQSRDSDEALAVRETLQSVIMLIEATTVDEAVQPQRRVHRKHVRKSPTKRSKKDKSHSGNNSESREVPERVQLLQKEEQERKAMYTEELHMSIMLERNRRSLERPFLRAQDAAHDAYIRLIEHCVNPTGFLSRLHFERCLAFEPPQKLVLTVVDGAESPSGQPSRFVLRTVPCRTEEMAEFLFRHSKTMQTLLSPFVAKVFSVSKHMFQLFSEPGLLIECWPVVLVVTELFAQGSWLLHYRKHFIEEESVEYIKMEQHLLSVFREVAAGLAAMHSLGLMHLNINLGNIFIAEKSDVQGNDILHVKLGGLLSWKQDFDDTSLGGMGIHECLNYSYMPPEALKELRVTAKADAWMLGCALCEALFIWQRQQLIVSTPNQPIQPTMPVIFHTKSVLEILEGPRWGASTHRAIMSKDYAQALTVKELFQAAQQDDFVAVRDYLQVILDEAAVEADVVEQKTIQSIIEAKTKNSLLHYACDNGNLDACKFLLMCDGLTGTFLNEINAFGHTPLFYAASSGHLPLVKWLISNGADIDTDYSDRSDIAPREGDQGIFTPLQIACFKGHEAVASFLVECNAELSGTRRNGKTPLHFASVENHPAIVKLLLEAGADVHACDDEGKTPVDVANAAVLPLLLPDEYGQKDGERDELEEGNSAGEDEEDNDEFEGPKETQVALESVKTAFGAEIARGFRSKSWKSRVIAITDASTSFQNVFTGKNVVKLFDGACIMMELALQDAVTQVVSCCCTSLLKVAFNAVMSEKDFHTRQFHEDRPVIRRIASALLTRGAGSNEKDASEAVASLLFLICKSVDLTRYLTAQISQVMISSSTSAPSLLSPKKSSDSASSTVSWRHQLVAIKILNTIASQYRMDEKTSGLNFADAMKISMLALDNSSVHVRTASIDLLVQCLVIRCEQSGT
ncbi:hypothetical protein BBJ28_00015878 [Nothophytophthora sp. Chile5]|nr:hypothetical protein BBJ28_00015878 [Nothophytophthora sp. Chile5]